MNFFEKLKAGMADAGLRGRLLFLAFGLFLSRLLAAIPMPHVDAAKLAAFFSGNDLFGFLNILSGGGLSTFSIVTLGVGPYISASVIMQVLTFVSPSIKSMYREEGQAGLRKFNQISRVLTVFTALVQGTALLLKFQSAGIVAHMTVAAFATSLVIITAGAILMMWLGELLTEFGIGNGTSLLVFAGILSRLPQTVSQFAVSFDSTQIPTYLAYLVVALLVIYAVVFLSEGERAVPVTYAKTVRGNTTSGGVSTYLPIRITQAGVMPIIFGIMILQGATVAFTFLSTHVGIAIVKSIALACSAFLANKAVFNTLYFLFVFLATYFYTAITFDTEQVAKNLEQSGAFIPGVRPGQATTDYLSRISSRITLVGALFLGIVAVLPLVIQSVTGITSFAIGGTAVLIVVSTVSDLVKRIEAQVTMREY